MGKPLSKGSDPGSTATDLVILERFSSNIHVVVTYPYNGTSHSTLHIHNQHPHSNQTTLEQIQATHLEKKTFPISRWCTKRWCHPLPRTRLSQIKPQERPEDTLKDLQGRWRSVRSYPCRYNITTSDLLSTVTLHSSFKNPHSPSSYAKDRTVAGFVPTSSVGLLFSKPFTTLRNVFRQFSYTLVWFPSPFDQKTKLLSKQPPRWRIRNSAGAAYVNSQLTKAY